MFEFFIVVAYIAITTFVGVYFSRKAQSSKDMSSFFLAKKNLGPILIMFLMLGEMVAGSSTVGSATTAFGTGFSSVWVNWGMAFGVFIFVFTVNKFYRTAAYMGAFSVPEAFEFRFGRKTRFVVMVIVMVVYGITFAMQPKAAAAILAPMIGVNVTVMTLIMAAIFIIQALVGLKGIAGMNIVHAFFLFLGLIVTAVLAITTVGGFGAIRDTLGAEYLSFFQPSFQNVLGTALGSMFGFILSSSLVANVYGARSSKAATTGVTLAACCSIILAFFPALIGVSGKFLFPDAAAGTILYTVADNFGVVVGALASMAIIAAVFSTAPALLLTLSTTLTRDFYAVFVNKGATEQQQLRFSKIAIVGIGVVCTILGLRASSILGSISGAFQIRSVAGLVLIISVFWKRVDKNSGFLAILCGGAVAAVWFFAGQPFGIAPFWTGNAVGLVVLVIATLTNKFDVAPEFAKYKECYANMMAEEAAKAVK